MPGEFDHDLTREQSIGRFNNLPAGDFPCQMTAEEIMINDEEAIRILVDDWMEATREGDIATVLDLMSDNVVFMVPGRAPFGKAEFAAASKEMAGVQFEGHSDIVEL